MKKRHQVNITVTAEEYTGLKARADALDLTVTVFTKMVALAGVEAPLVRSVRLAWRKRPRFPSRLVARLNRGATRS